ncbi:hypothetical protein HDV00_002345 [Rhizophlyctis rosea]|nr:hypothetical protein HDV00_002345 [Rhizophlyctis rosea]
MVHDPIPNPAVAAAINYGSVTTLQEVMNGVMPNGTRLGGASGLMQDGGGEGGIMSGMLNGLTDIDSVNDEMIDSLSAAVSLGPGAQLVVGMSGVVDMSTSTAPIPALPPTSVVSPTTSDGFQSLPSRNGIHPPTPPSKTPPSFPPHTQPQSTKLLNTQSSLRSSPQERPMSLPASTLPPITATISIPTPQLTPTSGLDPNLQYELVVRQQPVQARMSGFGIKDRRPLDPPPILQLISRNERGEKVPIDFNDAAYMIAHASLWAVFSSSIFFSDMSEEKAHHFSLMASTIPIPIPAPASSSDRRSSSGSGSPPAAPTPSSVPNGKRNGSAGATNGSHEGLGRSDSGDSSGSGSSDDSPSPSATPTTPNVNAFSPYTQILLGSLVSPCYMLNDANGERGLYFVFPDVSVRTSGQYRLKFRLFGVDCMLSSEPSTAKASVESEIFTVYSPKTFPGMSDSTDLSKCFARQGIRIHIRTDARNRRGSGDRDEDDV